MFQKEPMKKHLNSEAHLVSLARCIKADPRTFIAKVRNVNQQLVTGVPLPVCFAWAAWLARRGNSFADYEELSRFNQVDETVSSQTAMGDKSRRVVVQVGAALSAAWHRTKILPVLQTCVRLSVVQGDADQTLSLRLRAVVANPGSQ